MTVSDLDLAAENIKRRVDEFFHRAIIDPVTLRESNIEIHTQPGWGFEHSILYSIARKIIPAGWEWQVIERLFGCELVLTSYCAYRAGLRYRILEFTLEPDHPGKSGVTFLGGAHALVKSEGMAALTPYFKDSLDVPMLPYPWSYCQINQRTNHGKGNLP